MVHGGKVAKYSLNLEVPVEHEIAVVLAASPRLAGVTSILKRKQKCTEGIR